MKARVLDTKGIIVFKGGLVSCIKYRAEQEPNYRKPHKLKIITYDK